MSSRLRAVRIFTITYEKQMFLVRRPSPITPAADVPPRSRLRDVLIFEQNGALASTPCAFRFQAGSLRVTNCHQSNTHNLSDQMTCMHSVVTCRVL